MSHKKGGILCRGGAALLLVALLVGVGPVAQSALGQAFITTWETTTSDESITIPTNGDGVSNYDFEIDWGDGTVETITGEDPDPSHTHSSAGTHTVEISGTFPRIFLDAGFFADGDEANAKKLQSIDLWGDVSWESMLKMRIKS